MNLLEIIIIVVTILFIVSGFCRGFVRKLASMLSLVLSVVLVSAILPYVTDFIQNNTPLYDYIVEQCENVAATQLAELWTTSGAETEDESAEGLVSTVSSAGLSDGLTVTAKSTGAVSLGSSGSASMVLTSSASSSLADLTREEAKALMEQYGYGAYASLVDSLTDEEFEQYKEQYLGEYASQLTGDDGAAVSEIVSSLADSLSLDEETQNEIIDSLPIPEVVKNLLIRNNNEEGYASLNVATFQDYIIESLATMILNVIAFLVSVILVHLALRVLIMLLNILSHFPVVGVVNRLAGGVLGAIEALFVLWLFFLILTILQATEAGSVLLAMVEESALLTWLYESNLFLQIVVWAAAVFA